MLLKILLGIIGALFIAFISCLISIFIIKYKKQKKLVSLEDIYEIEKEQYEKDFSLFQNQLFIDAVESVNYRKLNYQTFTTVRCNDEERKKRILGKNSHNKRIIENLTCTNLLIQEDSPIIKVSCSNPYRRRICLTLLENLIESESDYIDEVRINKYYERAVEQTKQEAIDLGRDILENEFQVYNLNPKIYFYLGKLKQRFSYNQSALEHSIETAKIAGNIAKQLKLDYKKAQLCGLFHDIGKSIDLENAKSHVDMGLEIAEICDLDDEIKFCIKYHHERKYNQNIYLSIVKVADKLSASKEAARQGQQEDIEFKTKMIMEILKEFHEISKKSFCAKSAHFVGLILNSKDSLTQQEKDSLIARVKNRILLEEEFQNYILDVEIINK